MNFQQLRIIREVARCKFNLTDAANALLASQSTISKMSWGLNS
jgi:LysR family cys regulon transcriptional activator